MEAALDAGGGILAEVPPELFLVDVVPAFARVGIEAEGGVGRRGGRVGGDDEGEAVLLDVSTDRLDGLLDVAHLAQGFEAGAHDGGHGAGLAGIDDAAREGFGDLIEIEEDGVVVFGPDEVDEGHHVEGCGGGRAEPAAGHLEAAVVVEAELSAVECGRGAAGAVGFDVAAAMGFGWDEVFGCFERHDDSPRKGKGRSPGGGSGLF